MIETRSCEPITSYRTPAEFLDTLGWSSRGEIIWSGYSGWLKLKHGVLAHFQLSTLPALGQVPPSDGPEHYQGFIVDIVSETHGVLASESFAFADFLDVKQAYFSSAWGLHWKPNVNPDTLPLITVIEHFIDMFH